MSPALRAERDRMLRAVEAMPARRANAALVLRVCDDPRAGAHELGAAVLGDALLTTKLLALANSAYFGLSREIRDPTAAIGVLGFETVRGLALAQLAGALGSDLVPEAFWAHSARVGTACALLAPSADINGGEAFSVGLLHDLGRVLLADLGGEVDLGTDREPAEDLEAERASSGTDHCELGRHLCDVIQLPETFGLAIGHHHDDLDRSAPVHARLVVAGTHVASLDSTATDGDAVSAQLAHLGFGGVDAPTLAAALDAQSAHLVSVLH